jgi:hypothetical protein
MTLRNALASVAVKDVNSHRAWYAQLLGSEGSLPMLEASPTGFSRFGAVAGLNIHHRRSVCRGGHPEGPAGQRVVARYHAQVISD